MNTCDLPDGGRIAYADTGKGGPLVVLLHPGYTDHTIWTRELLHLGRRTHVIAPDARSHGRSSDGTQPFRQCDDLAVLLRHLGSEPAVLIGVSMGAGAAVDTAIEYPDLVRALVISGAGTNEPDFEDPWALAILQRAQAAVEAGDPQSWLAAMLDFVPGPARTLADVEPAVVAQIAAMHEAFVRDHVRPGMVTPGQVENSWDRLGEIAVPVLGVVGALDARDHHQMCKRAVSSVQNGTGVVSIDGAAHFPNLEQPVQWEGVIDRFLDEVGVTLGP